MAKSKSERILLGMKIVPIILLSIIVGLAFFYRDKITLSMLIDFTPQNSLLAIIYILICYAIKSISIVFPVAALFLLSGKIFDPLTASFVNLAGIILVVSIPYFVGRILGAEMAGFLKHKYPAIKKLDDFSSENQIFFSYITRAINLLPGDIVSLFLGSSLLDYKKYLVGSVLGMVPTMVAITIMGENITNPSSPKFLIALGVTVLFSLIGIPMYNFIKNKKR